MPPIKVLIVDDSLIARRVLFEALSSAPEIQVVGTSTDGRSALARMATLRPDVVTLDIEMPDMSGLELLAEIRKRAPKLPVIMFSSLTQRARPTTLEALALGATDYVTKPSSGRLRGEAALEQVDAARPEDPRAARAATRMNRPPAAARTLTGAQRLDRVSSASAAPDRRGDHRLLDGRAQRPRRDLRRLPASPRGCRS